MRERDHSPVLDFLVFGIALLLAGVLAYYSWQRFRPRQTGYENGYIPRGAGVEEGAPSEGGVIVVSGNIEPTETVGAVSRIPPSEGAVGKRRQR